MIKEIFLVLVVLLFFGCKKDSSSPVNVGVGEIAVDGVLYKLDNWGGGAIAGSGPRQVFTSVINNNATHWGLSVGGGLETSVVAPVTLDYDSKLHDLGIVVMHWPNYPSNSGLIQYSSHSKTTTGTFTLTRIDRSPGGKFEGSFSLQGVQRGQEGDTAVTTNHSLSGKFSVTLQ